MYTVVQKLNRTEIWLHLNYYSFSWHSYTVHTASIQNKTNLIDVYIWLVKTMQCFFVSFVLL